MTQKPPGERTRQNRIPGADWGAYRIKPPQSTARKKAAAGQPIGGPQQPVGGMPGKAGQQQGPSFALHGIGRYYNSRNASGQQFNHPAIHGAVKNILDAAYDNQYYRHAGILRGVRGALGLGNPSHANDAIQSRHHAATTGVRGINPGAFSGSPNSPINIRPEWKD